MWTSTDPEGQFWNSYGYTANPVLYVDPDGNWAIIDDIIFGAIGAVASYVAYGIGTGNWLSGQAFAMAAVGAGAGVGALYTGGAAAAAWGSSLGATIAAATVGGAAGGAISGLGGYSVGAAYGDHSWNIGGAAAVTGLGALSGAFGGFAGGAAAAGVGSIAINGTQLASPVLKGIVGGAVGGYAGGFTGGLIATGTLAGANQAGLNGLAIGVATGGVGGYVYAKNANIDPWTGASNRGGMGPVLKGQQGVEMAKSQIQAEGGSIKGEQVSLKATPNGPRWVVDIVYEKSSTIYVVEVKNGPGASFTPNQKIVIPQIQETGTAIPVGGNATQAGFVVQQSTSVKVRIIKY